MSPDIDQDTPGPTPRVEYTEPAEAELVAAYEWLQRFGFAAAENWLKGLGQALEQEAQLIGSVSFRRALVPESNQIPGRPLFLLLYRSGKRGSPWHIEYELLDEDGEGKPDILLVIRIRHAARGNTEE